MTGQTFEHQVTSLVFVVIYQMYLWILYELTQHVLELARTFVGLCRTFIGPCRTSFRIVKLLTCNFQTIVQNIRFVPTS